MERAPKMSSHESAEATEGREYEAVKAEAMLSAAGIMEEIGCPSEPAEMKEMDIETLGVLQTNLQDRINDLASGEDGQRNRLTIEYLSGYLRVAETIREGKIGLAVLLDQIEHVPF